MVPLARRVWLGRGERENIKYGEEGKVDGPYTELSHSPASDRLRKKKKGKEGKYKEKR